MSNFGYWQESPDLQLKLKNVQKIILDNLKIPKGKLGEALRYNFSTTGKEIRPALVLLFGEMGKKGKKQRLMNIASSVEILHNATLIHDDIIDDAPMRHGRASIQEKFGKHIALYAGDYLFALSLQLLSNNTSKITNLRINGNSMQDILAGETLQYDNEYNLQITEKDYLAQIKGKTGILFGYSCLIGSLEGGLSRSLAKKAQQFGELLGESFQLRDDILDYTAQTNQLQKPVLLDVVNGVYTGPLIFALERDSTHELANLVKIGKKLTPAQLVKIDKLVVDLGGILHAQELADSYTGQALSILENDFGNFTTTHSLQQLTKKLVNRTY